MQIVADLRRCQGYAQCVLLAAEVFELHGEEGLLHATAVPDEQVERVRQAAETLREEGFTGSLTVVGDEPHPPYDQPPLSKQVLHGQATADTTGLPMRRDPDADWRLGVRAIGVDLLAKRVMLDDGESLPYDRLLIATGTRARPWPNAEEGALEGVFTCARVRTPGGRPSGRPRGQSMCW